jgi:hypothetical protein
MLSLATYVFALPQPGRIARRVTAATLNVTVPDLAIPKITPFYNGNCPPKPSGWPSFLPWCIHSKPPPPKFPVDVKRSTVLEERESIDLNVTVPDIVKPILDPEYSGNCPPRPAGWPSFIPWCIHAKRPPPRVGDIKRSTTLDERNSVSSSAGGRLESHCLFTLSLVVAVGLAALHWV